MGRGVFFKLVNKVEVIDLSVMYEGCFSSQCLVAYSSNIYDIDLVIIYHDSGKKYSFKCVTSSKITSSSFKKAPP